MSEYEKDFKKIYATVTGLRRTHGGVSWVEDAFVNGAAYHAGFQSFWTARENLRQRFGLKELDRDLEQMLCSLIDMNEDIGKRLFQAGIRYAEKGYTLEE